MKPVTYIIFGITSDLSRTKLIAAAYQLWRTGNINHFVGVGRKQLSKQEFALLLRDALHELKQEDLDNFISTSSYFNLDFDDQASFEALKDSLPSHNLWIFHLALPPDLFLPTLKCLHASGSGQSSIEESHFLIEKPFGTDAESAQKLIQDINHLFSKVQIYRVDHYLGKSAVREILNFRSTCESVWNHHYINSIKIVAAEAEGIHNRGNYYDKTGAIRDMVQSHCLELLALSTMELPQDKNSEALRQSRVNLLQNIKMSQVYTGQYQGYRQETNVASDSKTETSVHITVRIDNDRWNGTSVEIVTGKKLGEKKTGIIVSFRSGSKDKLKALLPFPFKHIAYSETANRLEINIDTGSYSNKPDDAYANLITDCLRGDKSFFIRDDEVLAAWQATEPAIAYATNNKPQIY